MMQLQPPFDEIQRFWEKAYENGVRLKSRFGTGKIKVTAERDPASAMPTWWRMVAQRLGLWH